MRFRTAFAILMHPKEARRQRTGTGRICKLCLEGSRIIIGQDFDDNRDLGLLLADPALYPVLLFPGPGAMAPSDPALAAALSDGRRLLVIVLDATWPCARKMYRHSPILQALPRVGIAPSHPSRWLFKRQPRPDCLSTLEAIHELLLSLEEAGLEDYPDKEQLLGLFARLQEYQVGSAADPGRKHHAHDLAARD
jgi:DTW domain-containing protein YfiP